MWWAQGVLYNTLFNQLKPKLSSGEDFISNKLLKTIAPIIITPLHYIINLSLETGFVPSEMKIAKIVPVFKDGDCHDYNKYRPTSFLSSFSKLVEKIVSRQVIGFLNAHNILYHHQYLFRANHNTSQPVLHFADKIYNAFNQKPTAKTISIFIDLKKAFDTVDHKILLNKMAFYGVRGSAQNWFKNYLSDREQFLIINGVKSEKVKMICGVPKGSVQLPDIKIGGKSIEQVGTGCKEKYFKFVGHFIDDKMSWEGHII